MRTNRTLLRTSIVLAGTLAVLGTLGRVTANAREEGMPPDDVGQTPAVPAAADAATTAVGDAPPGSRPRTALAAAIAAVLVADAARLRQLEAQFFEAANPTAALAIEREIAAYKAGMEIRLMKLHARLARDEGRLDAAERIEAAIAEMIAAEQQASATTVAPRSRTLRDDAAAHGGSRP